VESTSTPESTPVFATETPSDQTQNAPAPTTEATSTFAPPAAKNPICGGTAMIVPLALILFVNRKRMQSGL